MTLQEIEAEIVKAGATLGPEIDGYRHCSNPVKMIVWDTDCRRRESHVTGVLVNAEYRIVTIGSEKFEFVRAIPQNKTRLMTPEEVAEGWLVDEEGSLFRVMCFTQHRIAIVDENRTFSKTVKEFHENAFKFAKTATSEPVSLEVAE